MLSDKNGLDLLKYAFYYVVFWVVLCVISSCSINKIQKEIVDPNGVVKYRVKAERSTLFVDSSWGGANVQLDVFTGVNVKDVKSKPDANSIESAGTAGGNIIGEAGKIILGLP